MPEVGDPDKPKLVFFFDEAHLLFADAPPACCRRSSRWCGSSARKASASISSPRTRSTCRTTVLAQMGNRVQHALRAYTPRDQKAVKAAATTFRPNPTFETEKAITELGKGEALVSVLDLKGVPTMVERTLIRPPVEPHGPDHAEASASSAIKKARSTGCMTPPVNRELAYEMLRPSQGPRDAASRRRHARSRPPRRPSRSGPRRPVRRARARDGHPSASSRMSRAAVGRQLGTMVVRKISNALVRGILGSLTRR